MLQKQIPNLAFNQELNRWELYLPPHDSQSYFDDRRYSMLVKVAFHGEVSSGGEDYRNWFEYRFVAHEECDWWQVLTSKQYNERLEAIRENEGDEAATIWDAGQNQVTVVEDNHPVFALKRHWEAMMELGIFWPTVTLSNWASKPLDPEVAQRMDTARGIYEQVQMGQAEAEGELTL
jgi:hypothetical protein